MDINKMERFARDHWKIGLLILILLVSYQIRLTTADMKYVQAFDPFFMYRYTELVVEEKILPDWDGLSYYPPGRPLNAPPLMFYVTGYLYLLYNAVFPVSLFVFAKYITAVYAALAVVPAYLLGKELSGKNAGLLSALFVGVSPSILARTMAGFYDTDTVVVFFSLFTMYFFLRMMKHTTLKKLVAKERVAWREFVLATTSFLLFLLAWSTAVYVPVIAAASVVAYFSYLLAFRRKTETNLVRNELVERIVPVLAAFLIGLAIAQLLGYRAFHQVLFLFTFAQDPSKILIVNVSVAELQKTSIFANNMAELFARISVPAVFALSGAILLFRKNPISAALLLTWVVASLLSITQGIRFLLVFAPAAAVAAGVALGEFYDDIGRFGRYAFPLSAVMLITIVLAMVNPLSAAVLITLMSVVLLGVFLKNSWLGYAAVAFSFLAFLAAPSLFGWGLAPQWLFATHVIPATMAYLVRTPHEADKHDALSKAISGGAMAIAVIIALSHGSQLAYAMDGGSIDSNWESALVWLRDNTAEDAVVGTWWDPGHQLTGFSGKRVIADGAHCDDVECSPGLNTRISDLGFIFWTSDEDAAHERLIKYRGDSSEMYWIASDDLIGKFRWLQYFGTGCDGVGELSPGGASECPLYSQFSLQRVSYGDDLQPAVYEYEGGVRMTFNNEGVPVVLYQSGETTATFHRQVFEQNGEFVAATLNSNNTVQGTAWIEPSYSYIVYVPEALENAMFTRMFLYEQELENFELAFDNGPIKIYRVKL